MDRVLCIQWVDCAHKVWNLMLEIMWPILIVTNLIFNSSSHWLVRLDGIYAEEGWAAKNPSPCMALPFSFFSETVLIPCLRASSWSVLFICSADLSTHSTMCYWSYVSGIQQCKSRTCSNQWDSIQTKAHHEI